MRRIPRSSASIATSLDFAPHPPFSSFSPPFFPPTFLQPAPYGRARFAIPPPPSCAGVRRRSLYVMSLNSSPTKPTSPSHGRSRNFFLSKFRSQLGHRNRSITDFYVEPDDPWRTYSPGDSIKGTVVLTVVRPVRVTHLVICLHGFVKVFKNTVASAEAAPDIGFLGPGRGRRGSEYLGNGLATLFEDEVVLCGEGRLKEGIYKFRFDMLFPPYALPSSITVCSSLFHA